MLAPPQRPKRPRSPSPSLEPEISDLASPLDILLKRRKKEQHQHFGLPDSPHSGALASPVHTYDQDYFNYYQNTQAESSSTPQIKTGLEMGVERRRTKQWDKINAPPSGAYQHQQQYHYPQGHLATPITHPAQAAPSSAAYPFPTPLPVPHASNAAPLMSSSPIRNQPPSSSPFREKAENMQEEHWIDEEEMRREWGEAYTEQNSLLHNLVCHSVCKFPKITKPSFSTWLGSTQLYDLLHPHGRILIPPVRIDLLIHRRLPFSLLLEHQHHLISSEHRTRNHLRTLQHVLLRLIIPIPIPATME